MFDQHQHLHEIIVQNNNYPMIIQYRSSLSYHINIRTIKNQYETPKRSRPNGKDFISYDDLLINVFLKV